MIFNFPQSIDVTVEEVSARQHPVVARGHGGQAAVPQRQDPLPRGSRGDDQHVQD